MKYVPLVAIFCIIILSMGCGGPDCAQPEVVTNLCKDTALANVNHNCTEEYAPVCGCDAVTYDNACKAFQAGVSDFSTGECCQ